MSDIVERLREKKVMVFKPTGDTGLVTSSLEIEPDAKEAADEIERLREKVFNLETEVHFDDQAIKSLQEINERLREALRYYANKKEEDWKNGQDDGVIARAALKEKE